MASNSSCVCYDEIPAGGISAGQVDAAMDPPTHTDIAGADTTGVSPSPSPSYSVPDSWNSNLHQTPYYAVPVIIVASVLLAICIALGIVGIVLWRHKRAKEAREAEKVDVEKSADDEVAEAAALAAVQAKGKGSKKGGGRGGGGLAATRKRFSKVILRRNVKSKKGPTRQETDEDDGERSRDEGDGEVATGEAGTITRASEDGSARASVEGLRQRRPALATSGTDAEGELTLQRSASSLSSASGGASAVGSSSSSLATRDQRFASTTALATAGARRGSASSEARSARATEQAEHSPPAYLSGQRSAATPHYSTRNEKRRAIEPVEDEPRTEEDDLRRPLSPFEDAAAAEVDHADFTAHVATDDKAVLARLRDLASPVLYDEERGESGEGSANPFEPSAPELRASRSFESFFEEEGDRQAGPSTSRQVAERSEAGPSTSTPFPAPPAAVVSTFDFAARPRRTSARSLEKQPLASSSSHHEHVAGDAPSEAGEDHEYFGVPTGSDPLPLYRPKPSTPIDLESVLASASAPPAEEEGDQDEQNLEYEEAGTSASAPEEEHHGREVEEAGRSQPPGPASQADQAG